MEYAPVSASLCTLATGTPSTNKRTIATDATPSTYSGMSRSSSNVPFT